MESWENELFDRWNGERKSNLEIEADLWDTLDRENKEEE